MADDNDILVRIAEDRAFPPRLVCQAPTRQSHFLIAGVAKKE